MREVYKNPVAEFFMLNSGDVMNISKLALSDSKANDVTWAINMDSWI